jgi:hypothetical protein
MFHWLFINGNDVLRFSCPYCNIFKVISVHHHSDGRTLVEYEIQRETLEIKTIDKVSVAEVKIVIRRRMEYHLYNTVAQTLILVLVGYMSYYFNLDDFNARIMVTLTTMLVIATTTAAIQLVRQEI